MDICPESDLDPYGEISPITYNTNSLCLLLILAGYSEDNPLSWTQLVVREDALVILQTLLLNRGSLRKILGDKYLETVVSKHKPKQQAIEGQPFRKEAQREYQIHIDALKRMGKPPTSRTEFAEFCIKRGLNPYEDLPKRVSATRAELVKTDVKPNVFLTKGLTPVLTIAAKSICCSMSDTKAPSQSSQIISKEQKIPIMEPIQPSTTLSVLLPRETISVSPPLVTNGEQTTPNKGGDLMGRVYIPLESLPADRGQKAPVLMELATRAFKLPEYGRKQVLPLIAPQPNRLRNQGEVDASRWMLLIVLISLLTMGLFGPDYLTSLI